MIIELGHYALVMALLFSLLQAVIPLRGAALGKQAWMLLGRQAAVSVFWLVTIGFLALLHAFSLSDLSVRVVAEHSHTMKPLLYKIAALWGHHEGSMLLWLWMLSFWAALVAETGKHLPPAFKARVLSVLGMMSAGFCLFILATSNPFLRLDPPAPEGLDLNPVLQDPLLAAHPPVLYAGYVGFSVAFAFAAAALMEGRADRDFARAVRPWVLAAWGFMTAGIALGSFWAYYELGWGGFWFWDPVENASLMPWLAGLALLHSLVVLEKKGALANWSVFLSVAAFSLSLLGTFLVRSGVLTSVHAFASDPLRGIFILSLLALFTGGALLLYGFRAQSVAAGAPFGPASRESAMLFNNVFLMAFAVAVFTGTLYPVFLSALDLGAVSVGGPYYIAVLMPLLLPFAFLMGVSPRLPWTENVTPALARKYLPAAVAAAAMTAGVFVLPYPKTFILAAGSAAAFWIFFATVFDVAGKNLRTLTAGYWAMSLAHAGVAVLILGCVMATQGTFEKILWMKPADVIEVPGGRVALLAVETGIGQNYNLTRGVFSFAPDGGEAVILAPEKRWYPAAEKETSEAALLRRGADILYVVLGDEDEKDAARRVVRVYHHPLVLLVFAGAAMMAAGAVIGLFGRKGRA